MVNIMFDKNESKKYVKCKINGDIKVKRIGNNCYTNSFVVFENNNEKQRRIQKDHFDYEKKKIDYLERVIDNKTKEYDKNIINLYNNGIIVIDGNEYPLKKFFIKYDLGSNDVILHLTCINSNFTDILTNSNGDYQYNGVVRFRDTECFISLINSDAVSIDENRIVIINKEKSLNIINEWNGMLHSLVPETDAIEKKQIFVRNDIN